MNERVEAGFDDHSLVAIDATLVGQDLEDIILLELESVYFPEERLGVGISDVDFDVAGNEFVHVSYDFLFEI